MTQDLYYIESGYLTPDAGYYVYTADAESAVSSQATMDVTAGVIKDCVSTITCQATTTAVVSHIHGADLVAFSNAAIATEINVIRTTNVALTSVFSAAIDAVRGIYVSAQADSTALISIANSRVRFTEAAHSAAFSLACEATKIFSLESNVSATVSLTCEATKIAGAVYTEASADLTSSTSLEVLGGKRQRFEIAQVSLSSQSASAERTRDTGATIDCQAAVSVDVGIIKQGDSLLDIQSALAANESRIRDVAIAQLSAFTPTLTVDVFKNSFAVLDATTSLTVASSITVGYQANITSQSSITAEGSIYKLASSNLASEFTATAVGIKPSRVVGDPTITRGAGYSDLTIDTTNKKFGAGSLRFHSRPSYTANRSLTVAGNTVVSTSQKQFGAGSVFFDGNTDNIDAGFDSDFNFSTGNFTIECWIRPQTLVGTDYIFSFRNDASTAPLPVLYLDNGVLKYATPVTVRITGSTLNTSTWYHIALARSGTSTKLFVNGTQVGSTYTDSNNYITGRAVFGSDYQNSSSSGFSGYMDDIHVSKGIARYTSNFTAPTQAITPDTYSVLLINGNTSIADSHADWQTILSVPSVAYPDSNKWRTWKTLDFWLYVTPGHPTTGGIWHSVVGQGLVNSSDYWSLLLESSGGGTHLFALTAGAGGTWSANSSNVSNFADNQWSHIRLIYDAGSIALFVNGTKTYTWTSVNILDVPQPLLFGGNGNYVGYRGTGDVYYDEVMISEVALTSISATSFTVPTSPYSNTVNTNLLLHFDSDFFDDASQIPKLLSGQAALTSAAAQSTQTIKTAEGLATISSASSLSALAVKNAEIILTAFGNASLTTNGQRLRYAESAQASQFSLTADNIRVRYAESAQASEFTQTATVVKTVNPTVSTDAIFTELAAVARTGAGFVQLDAQATMSVTAVKTARITDAFTRQFTQIANSVKSVNTSANISAASTLTVNNTRTRNQILVYVVVSQLETIIGEIEQFSIGLTAVSSLSAETGGILQGYADISSQSSLASTVLRTRDISSNLSSEAAVLAQTNNSKISTTSAALASETTQTASVGIIKTSAITTDAIFTELAAVVKTGQGFITLDVQAVQTTAAVKTAGAEANFSTQANLSATATRIQATAANLNTASAFTVSGTFVTTASANFVSTTSFSCNVVKTVNVISLEASAGTLTAAAITTKSARANLSVLAFELAVGSRTQRASAALVSISSVNARASGAFQLQAALQGFAAEVIVADIIHIDAKLTWMIFADDREYSISADNRTYSITADDRDYLIVQEDREYAVTRELLTTELQGV